MADKLTVAEWECVEKRIMTGVGATLLVDGIRTRFRLARLRGTLALGIVSHLDVELLKRWVAEDCPERRLFFRPVTTSVWTAKQKAAIARMSKKQLKRMNIDPTEKVTRYFPWWTQFKPLKAHLCKTATSIELIEE